jgi:NADPH:quinone reductase-like Zn-dependent oxidoreductase
MKAAVVTRFDRPPSFLEFRAPEPVGEYELLIDVLAVGLHPRVRSQSAGVHYTSTDELPLVPGIDGVGRDRDGALRYFVLPDTTMGSMAQRTVIDARRSILLPPGADSVRIAAVMNPAMSSWVALRQRLNFQGGQRVLVLGATGSAGQLAVQIAGMLGAREVIGAGRDSQRLAALTERGAAATIRLGTDSLAEAADVDVVLDYLWGEPTAAAMAEMVTARSDRRAPLTWVQIGSVAGPVAAVPSAALRAARLQIVGSGQGSVTTAEILAELTELVSRVGAFDIDVLTVPLADVEQAWTNPTTTGRRVVITPNP